jgi:TPR repeat protein
MKILSCLLILCIFVNTPCSKANDPVVEFASKAQAAYSKKNYEEAFEYYKKAADLGDAKAMCGLGVLYHSGEGVIKDYKEAIKWYKKAAELGSAQAMFGLGIIYANGGLGVTKNYKEALKWHQKAAELGIADSMYNLGFMGLLPIPTSKYC